MWTTLRCVPSGPHFHRPGLRATRVWYTRMQSKVPPLPQGRGSFTREAEQHPSSFLQVMGAQGQMHILGDAGHHLGQGTDVLNPVIDVLPQLAWVGAIAQRVQWLTACAGNGLRITHAVEGWAGIVVAALDLGELGVVTWDDDLLLQPHDGLEEVVEDPHLVIQGIEGQHLSDGVEALITQVSPHEGAVLLLDSRIVILVKGRLREMVTPCTTSPQKRSMR